MSLLPVLALGAVVLGLGTAFLAAGGDLDPGWSGGPRAAGPGKLGAAVDAAGRATVAGLLLFYLLLLALDGLGVPWRRRSLAAGVAVLAVALSFVAWRRQGREREPTSADRRTTTAAPCGWGDGVALACVAVFAWACWQRLVAIPDFVYHWGVKGKRFWLAGGVDVAFLADPLHLTDQADYPNLLPSLYAALAHLRGFFDERTMLLVSPLFLALLLAGARTALAGADPQCSPRREGSRRWSWTQAGTAAVALLATLFAIGYDLAGGGDLVMAAGPVLALPALLPRDDATPWLRRRDDLTVGLAAALAAATKIEGVALAALLVVVRLAVDRGSGRLAALRRLPRLAGPAALVVLPWLVTCWRHDLFRDASGGALDLSRLGTVARSAFQVFNLPEWFGLPWLLVALPVLLLHRRLRPAAALLLAQGGFYLVVYLVAVAEPGFYVLSSLPRLLYHLLPASVVLLALAAAGWEARSGRT